MFTTIHHFDVNKYSQVWSDIIHNFGQQVSTILVNTYPQFWNTSINKFDQQILTILNTTYSYFWSNNIHNSDQQVSTILTNTYTQFDQTSTLGVSKFGRSLDNISTKLRHWGCRSLVEVWRRSLVDTWSNTLIWQCGLCIYRVNFDQTSTLGVSGFGRSLVDVSIKTLQSIDTCVKVWAKCLPNLKPEHIHNFDQHTSTILTQQVSHFWSAYILNADQTVQTIYMMLININSQVWSTYIHQFDQNVYTSLSRQYLNVWPWNIISLAMYIQIWNSNNIRSFGQIKIMTNNHNSELFDLLGIIISASVCNYKMYVTII